MKTVTVDNTLAFDPNVNETRPVRFALMFGDGYDTPQRLFDANTGRGLSLCAGEDGSWHWELSSVSEGYDRLDESDSVEQVDSEDQAEWERGVNRQLAFYSFKLGDYVADFVSCGWPYGTGYMLDVPKRTVYGLSPAL